MFKLIWDDEWEGESWSRREESSYKDDQSDSEEEHCEVNRHNFEVKKIIIISNDACFKCFFCFRKSFQHVQELLAS